jgi:hypothetical protein
MPRPHPHQARKDLTDTCPGKRLLQGVLAGLGILLTFLVFTGFTAAQIAISGTNTKPTDRQPADRKPADPQRTESPGIVGRGPIELTWTNILGDGGARVGTRTRLPARPRPRFSRLVAVVFGRDGEIHFLGKREPKHELLKPEDLIDAFVLAYRAQVTGQHAPGVTIDPTPEQLEQGLRENDLMSVRYLGGSGGTVVGRDSYLGDLHLKHLGLGKNSLTKKPMTSRVKGYRSELTLLASQRLNRKQTWHRFWIEVARSQVRQSRAGNTFLLDTTLQVQTEYMVPQGGKLVPGKADPDPSALSFTQHLTKHFDAYADEFPALHRLRAYAQMGTLASAVRPPSRKAPDDRARPQLDRTWLLEDHHPRAVDTHSRTPATIASATLVRPGGRITRALKGGVNLGPKNTTFAVGDATVEALEQAVQKQVQANPDRPEFSVTVRGQQLEGITYRPPALAADQLWQTIPVGELPLVYEYPPKPGALAVGEGGLRLPQVSFSRLTVQLAGQPKKRPRAVSLVTRSGKRLTLDRIGQGRLPGQNATLTYTSQDGQHRLYVFDNVLLYLGGKVGFVARAGEPPRMQLHDGAEVIRFSGKAPHRVEKVDLPTGSIEVIYEGDTLTGWKSRDRSEVQVKRNARGEVIGLVQTKGGNDRIAFRFMQGQTGKPVLRAIVNQDGQGLSFDYGASDELQAVHADPVAGARVPAGDFYHATPSDRDIAEAVKRLEGTLVIRTIREAPAGKGDQIEIHLGEGKKLTVPFAEVDGKLGRYLEKASPSQAEMERIGQALRRVLGEAISKNKGILVAGPLARRLALALKLAARDRFIAYAADLQRAVKNFQTRAPRKPVDADFQEDSNWLKRKNVWVCKRGLSEGQLATLRPILRALEINPLPGRLVFAHHTAEAEAALRQAGPEWQDQPVIVVACGVNQRNVDSEGLARDLLYQGGESGVSSVSLLAKHIPLEFLPTLLERLPVALARGGERGNLHEASWAAWQTTLEQMLKDARNGNYPKWLDKEIPRSDTPEEQFNHFKDLIAPLWNLLFRLSRRPSWPGQQHRDLEGTLPVRSV